MVSFTFFQIFGPSWTHAVTKHIHAWVRRHVQSKDWWVRMECRLICIPSHSETQSLKKGTFLMLHTRTNSHYQPSLQFENNEVVGRFGGRVECCIRNLSSNILPPIHVVKNFGKYLYISNLKFTMNGCRHKFVIF